MVGVFWGDYKQVDVYPFKKCGGDGPLTTIKRVKKEGGHCAKYTDWRCNKPDPNDEECHWQSGKLS